MSDLSYFERSARRTVNVETCGLKSKSSRNEILEKLLALLTTDVQELANSLWDILDSDKEGSNVNITELAKLKKENEVLKSDLENKRKTEDERSEMETNYKELRTMVSESKAMAEDEKKLRKEIEKKYQELKQQSLETLKLFKDARSQMEDTIDQQKEKIQALQRAEGKAKETYRTRDDRRENEKQVLEKYEALEKQHRTTREKLKKTEEELDETKTRLSKALGLKLLDNNPSIADLSDKYRPTKLAEIYQEIYDKEWTDAFECIKEKEGDDEKKVVSALVNILMETKSVCEKETEKQMEQIQLALTQDENRVDKSIISNINKQLKECRKQVAAYSGKQVYKKYYKELKYSFSSTAEKAKLVPEYLEACFSVCWLMTVQDPPVVFGPDIKRGDTFDTDLYKAYTKSGKTVAYVVWPALLLHKGGPILCKGIAQGIANYSNRPKSAPNENYEIDIFFSRSDRDYKRYKDVKSVADIEESDDILLDIEQNCRSVDKNDRQLDSSYRTYSSKATGTFTTNDRGNTSEFRGNGVSTHRYGTYDILRDSNDHRSYHDSDNQHKYGAHSSYNRYQVSSIHYTPYNEYTSGTSFPVYTSYKQPKLYRS